MTTATVLRIRPHNLKNDGLLRAELTTLAQSFANSSQARFLSYNFHPDVSQDGDQVLDLAGRLSGLLGDDSRLVLDLGYRQVERRTFNFVLAAAFIMNKANLGDEVRILVLLDNFWKESDPFMTELRQDPWDRVVRIADSDGNVLESDRGWPVTSELADQCRMSSEARLKVMGRRFIRSRGVFKNSTEADTEFELFRYYGDHASDVVTGLFDQFMGSRELDAILMPENVSPWFSRAVSRVAVERHRGRPVLTPAQLRDPPPDLVSAVDALRATGQPSLCIALPVYRYGRSLRRITEFARSFFTRPHLSYVSILAQETQAGARVVDGIRRRQVKNSDYTLHYFLPIPAVGVGQDHWLVRAAAALGEIQVVPAEFAQPTTTAMWALFEKIGLGPEEPYTDQSRPRLSHFPCLSRLEQEDAKWLAYCLLRRISGDPEDVLIVVPEERSGALPLAEAFERCLDVAVVGVPRTTIKRGRSLSRKTAALIDEYADRHIVICDESSISGGTIEGLNKLIRKARGHGADQVLVALDAPIQAPSTPYSSLYSWTPLLMEDGNRDDK